MTVEEELAANTEIAAAGANALAVALGNETRLAASGAVASIADAVGDQPTRVAWVAVTSDEHAGMIAIVATEPLANALESAAADETFPTAMKAALHATADALGTLLNREIDIDLDATRVFDGAAFASEIAADAVVFPVLDGDDAVACIVLQVGAAAPVALVGAAAAPASPMSSPCAGNRFALAEVEMAVTAELGRAQMTVRDLLSIAPGAVVDLDRAAGAPVDLLVNGTTIARGEVVVIDEEFGVRITEILGNHDVPPTQPA